MYSNRYTMFYAMGVTVAAAVVLSLAVTGLADRQNANAARARRSDILRTVMTVNPETLEADYNAFITERVFDSDGSEVSDIAAFDLDIVREARKTRAERLFPVYEFEQQGRINYIVPIQGAGLWGPISAYVALEGDLNTISGVSFAHEKETPGLGAEISTPSFQSRFEGKQLFDNRGEFVSVRVIKGGATADDPHGVDGLTGATMTMNGVTEMFSEELELYQPILQALVRN